MAEQLFSRGDQTPANALSRRALLRGALAVAGASLLAACTPAPSGTGAGTGATSAAAPTTAPKPTTAPAAAASSAPAAAASSAPAQAGAAPASIKIGAVIPMTGKYASLGEQVHNGYDLAVKQLNAAGGVMTKPFNKKIPLVLNVLDDASDPNQTVQRLETFNSQGVDVYFGGAGSDLHAAAAAVAEKNQIPYLGIAFGLLSIHKHGYKYLFSPFPKSPDMAKTIFDIMDGASPKPTKLALFPEKTDWGAEIDGFWKQEAQKRGYTVAVDASYAPGTTDYSSIVLQAKQANVDGVLAVPTPPDGIAIFKQMKELGLNAKIYSFIRCSDNSSWAKALGKDGDYNLFCDGWSSDVNYPGTPQLLQAYQQAYGKPAEGLVGASYAVVQIVADALGRQAAHSHAALRDALASTDMKTSAIGPVAFNADGTGKIVTVFTQWQNQKQVGVWPKNVVPGTVAYPAKPWGQR